MSADETGLALNESKTVGATLGSSGVEAGQVLYGVDCPEANISV